MSYDIVSQNKTKPPNVEDIYIWQFDNDERARFNSDAWPLLLRLAESYGWKPAGTQPGSPFFLDTETGEYDESRDPSEWDGSYGWNDGQIVTAHDAAMLADALASALDDIPDHEIEGKFIKVADWYRSNNITALLPKYFEDHPDIVVYGPNTEGMHPFEYFSGELKERVKSFIRLCRKGAFAIW